MPRSCPVGRSKDAFLIVGSGLVLSQAWPHNFGAQAARLRSSRRDEAEFVCFPRPVIFSGKLQNTLIGE
jgi:hypothetical protein